MMTNSSGIFTLPDGSRIKRVDYETAKYIEDCGGAVGWAVSSEVREDSLDPYFSNWGLISDSKIPTISDIHGHIIAYFVLIDSDNNHNDD